MSEATEVVDRQIAAFRDPAGTLIRISEVR